MVKLTIMSGLLLALAALLGACDSGSGGSPPDTPPGNGGTTPEPQAIEMQIGEDYPVVADDRLVTTSADPADIELLYTLDPDSGEDDVRVRLRSGSADLFQ